MNFRGIVRGRLLLSTKLLPIRYALRTWLVTILALAKDLRPNRWQYAKDRISVLALTGWRLRELLRERRHLFAQSGCSPERQLATLLGLPRG